uniref:DUF4942 domain-containing protein n=1 Tax=Gongylonema pulchrum TaxID=637853 RepID=A0A183D4K0_9BILA
LIDPEDKYNDKDKLSQINTLQQLGNAATYIAGALRRRETDLHGMWFELENADMYLFSRSRKRFIVINEENFEEIVHDVRNWRA